MDGTTQPIKTRFCLISDTHDQNPKPAAAGEFAYRQPLPSADVLLHAGDLTMSGGLKKYKQILEWLKASDAELKIVIAGNHDIDLHEEYYLTHSRKDDAVARRQAREVKELWTGPEARGAGVVYLDEGLNTFTLKSGATFTVGSCRGVCLWRMLNSIRYIPLLGSPSSGIGHSIIHATKTASILQVNPPIRHQPIPSPHGRM